MRIDIQVIQVHGHFRDNVVSRLDERERVSKSAVQVQAIPLGRARIPLVTLDSLADLPQCGLPVIAAAPCHRSRRHPSCTGPHGDP